MMKKMISLLLALAMMLALVSCSNNASPNTDTDSDTSAPGSSSEQNDGDDAKQPDSGKDDSEGIVLHIASPKVEWADTWDKLKEAYLASHSEIADIEYTLVSGTDLYTDLKAMLQTDSFPDIVGIQDGAVLLSWKDQLLPLNDYTDMFSKLPGDTVMTGFTDTDGTIYGIPTHTEAWGVLYNMDILAQAGVTEVPQTKSEFVDMCEKLTAAGLPTGVNYYKESYVWTVHAFSMMGLGQNEKSYIDYFNNLMTSTDLDLQDDVGMQNYFDFLDLSLKYGNADSLTMDRSTAQEAFYNEQYAFITIGGTWNNSQILSVNPDLLDHVALGPCPLTDDPEQNDIIAIVQGLSIYKDSKHLEEAKEWLTWLLTSDEAADILVNNSSVMVCRNDVEFSEDNVGVLSTQANEYIQNDRYEVLWTFFPTEITERMLVTSQKYIGGTIDRETAVKELEETFELTPTLS